MSVDTREESDGHDCDGRRSGAHKSEPQASYGQYEAQLALLLTATPGGRAKLFANPVKYIGRNLPPARYWQYIARGFEAEPALKGAPVRPYTTDYLKTRLGELRPLLNPFEYRRAKRRLAKAVLLHIASQIEGKKLASQVNTDAVFEEFFEPIVKVSRRSVTSVFGLSYMAFAVGVALIAVGAIVALTTPSGVNSTVVSSVFGGSGAISALGAVYAMAKQGIREATLDQARLRMVLTGFATQLGQLRALAESAPTKELRPLPDVEGINKAVTEAMEGALKQLPSIAEAQVAKESGQHDGDGKS